MIVDVTNEIITALKTSLTGVTVLIENPSTIPTFPCVVIVDNSTDKEDTIDSAGVQHNTYEISCDIYSNTQTKVTDCKTIRNSIDSVIGTTFGMTRTFNNSVPNYADKDVYRYMLRYTAVIDKNKVIYRR